MTAVVLVAFFAYLYLPHVMFKTAAELYVDLGRKQNASQLEEIASAVLPSLILHGFTFAALKLLAALTPLRFPGVDWSLIGMALSGEGSQVARSIGRAELFWTIAYPLCVIAVSVLNGALYGKSRYVRTVLSADPRLYPDAGVDLGSRSRVVRLFATVLATYWDLLYGEYHVALHRWSVLSPFVFVKTNEGQLLHGRFLRYDRSRDGEIDAITLVQVSRYSRTNLQEVLKRGDNPISRLEGELYIKWNAIIDINVTTPEKLTELWQQYEHERKTTKKTR